MKQFLFTYWYVSNYGMESPRQYCMVYANNMTDATNKLRNEYLVNEDNYYKDKNWTLIIKSNTVL